MRGDCWRRLTPVRVWSCFYVLELSYFVKRMLCGQNYFSNGGKNVCFQRNIYISVDRVWAIKNIFYLQPYFVCLNASVLCSVVSVQVLPQQRSVGCYNIDHFIYCTSPNVSLLQGFHRYSTDSSWHVPHFEKMLYDQAQLAVAYITASQVCVWLCLWLCVWTFFVYLSGWLSLHHSVSLLSE